MPEGGGEAERTRCVPTDKKTVSSSRNRFLSVSAAFLRKAAVPPRRRRFMLHSINQADIQHIKHAKIVGIRYPDDFSVCKSFSYINTVLPHLPTDLFLLGILDSVDNIHKHTVKLTDCLGSAEKLTCNN